MATQGRRTDPSLEDLLFEEGYRFDFFQSVRVLERVYAERSPVGGEASPSQEVVRFHAHLSMAFPPSAVHEIRRPEDADAPAHMTVAFMGLTGPLGVLPPHYTELLFARTRGKDHALQEFLDLFNHRLLSLFYRAWQKYRFWVGYDRAVKQQDAPDRFSPYLFDLMGMGTPGLRGKLEVADRALLFYPGLLGKRPHSAKALEDLLADYFGVPISVIQFTGQWFVLSDENRSRLASDLSPANNVLGVSAMAGAKVWDPQAKFTLRVGPLTYRQLCNFLPSGSGGKPLVQLSRFFAGQEFDFDIELVLKAAEVPACRLGPQEDTAPRLGWSTWLKTTAFTHDAHDCVLSDDATRVGAFPG